jgi:hypothetical protein
MNPQTQLDQALEALRHEHRSIQPPPSLEATILEQALLAAPRRAHTVRTWTIALATAATLAIAVILLYPRPSHPAIETRTTPPPPPQTTQTPPAHNTATTPRTRQHPRSTPRPAPSHQSAPSPFVPLPASEGLPAPAQATVIRTRIDTNSLWSYGLTPPPPGAPSTVLVEFVVGEDGLPRAIRLIP